MTQKLPDNIKRVHEAWGNGVRKIDPTLGPLESEITVYAESAVHEFCHAALYGLRVEFGRAKGLIGSVNDCARRQKPWVADLSEVRTLAAESLVLQELQIHVPFLVLLDLGVRNTQIIHSKTMLSRFIRSARRTPKVQLAAKAVIKFIKEGTVLNEQRSNPRGTR